MNRNAMDIRNTVKGIYDIQKLRIASGNRVVANFYIKMGIEPGEKVDGLEEKDKKMIKELQTEYKRITDMIVESNMLTKTAIKRSLEKGSINIISDEAEYSLVKSYMHLLESEEEATKSLAKQINNYPIYNEFLKGVKGCGTLMSGVIISEFDIYSARHCSSFWKYAGLDVVVSEDEDGNIVGEGRSRKAKHLVDVEYADKNGEIKTKKSITYNAFLKSKLIGVLGGCLIKSQGYYYTDVYLGYKNRISLDPARAEYSKDRLNKMAIRYMIKMFLRDLWMEWRALEGLSVTEPWEVKMLGMKPHKAS